jgi:teichuronic acid biosynthesis glycosyltransferase TuaG
MKGEDSMVSIVMPAYNAGKTVRKSVESVIAQTFLDWELIVIDDGSRDDTASILSELAEKDDRIHFLQNEKNSGASYTRNRAVSIAKGEWIAFLDSDDLWMPEKLEKQLALTEKYPDMAVCYTASTFIDEDGNPYEYVMPAVEQLTYKTLLHKNLMSCSSVMIRASIMKNIKMPNDKMHEDYFVWLSVLREYGVAYGIDEPLLIYRLCKNSKSGNRFKSAKMLFNSYRAVGYNCIAACVLVIWYTIHSVTKRKNIYSKKG